MIGGTRGPNLGFVKGCHLANIRQKRSLANARVSSTRIRNGLVRLMLHIYASPGVSYPGATQFGITFVASGQAFGRSVYHHWELRQSSIVGNGHTIFLYHAGGLTLIGRILWTLTLRQCGPTEVFRYHSRRYHNTLQGDDKRIAYQMKFGLPNFILGIMCQGGSLAQQH